MELMKAYSERNRDYDRRRQPMHLADTVYYIQPGEVALSENGRFEIRCSEAISGGKLVYCFNDLELYTGKCMEVSIGRIMQKFQSVFLQPQAFYEQAYRIRREMENGNDTAISG